ncbi:MAG TPA: ankyrin repeat domain-containing protein, partial [Rhabdochlamydiaceae bacterium]
MKSIWNILNIGSTYDTKTIRSAYASRLRETHPEEDPEGFQELRGAYEAALKYAAGAATTPVKIKNTPPPPTIFSIPKAPPLENAPTPSDTFSNIPKTPPLENAPTPSDTFSTIPNALPLEPEPEEPLLSPEESQAREMIEELEQCSSEPEKAELLKKWKEKGAFASFGVSLHFQNCLLEFLSEERKPLLHLFLAAYALFDWNDLRQKTGHPLTQKLIDLIEQSDLEESLILLDEVQEFPFLFAALVDDVASAKLLLAENPDLLNEPSDEDNTALHIACAVRSLDFLSFLINEEIDLEESNNAGKTALILAIEQNDLELVELLFEAGADVNGENDRGQTPLYVGIRSGAHEDLIYCLLDHPELECDPEALNAAVLLKKTDLIDLLLECGWEISPKKTRSGNSPLILAVLSNDLKLVDHLLSKGANPQQTEKAGSTALILAAERGFTQILERLLAHRVPENEILLAAHAAIKYNHFYLLPPLLERFDLNTSMGILYFRSIKMQMYVQG